MAFDRPTLASLVEQIQTDFVSRLALTGNPLRRSIVHVLSRVLAGAAHMLHGHLEYLSRQLFADTAESEYLTRIGGVFGVTPTAPTFATGNVEFTGDNGELIPAGTVLLRSDGAEYTTDADATIAGGTATASVTASLAAAAGDCDAGVSLAFESPIAGVVATATVAAGGLSGGTDAESESAYRTRVLARMRNVPHGGASADYVAWAKEVPGVTRAWVFPLELGAGTVAVRFVRDADVSLIPDAGEVATVQAYIDERRPVTAAVTVSAPVEVPLTFAFASITPDTTAVRAAIVAELEDYLLRNASPGATLPLSQIRTAIGQAEGLADYSLTSPAADVVPATGELFTFATAV
jgi:uncharacterized phage protein gp47/JayE